MKRFYAVLLSLGLIVALCSSVFAAEVKFNGEFFLQGWYNKNAFLIDKDSAAGPGNRGSSAFYTQRLRMGINFEVTKGLKLVTRFDALERKWMAARKTVPANNGVTTTDNEHENIGFEIAYVQFVTPIGIFIAGNMPAGQFGTPFNDYIGWDNPVIVWMMAKGPWVVSASLKKSQDGAAAPAGTAIGGGTDFDADSYTLKGEYKWKSGSAGVQLTEYRRRVASATYNLEIPFAILYAKNKFGRIFIEDEMLFNLGGKYLDYVNPAATDVKNDFALSNYFNINIDLSPANVGFLFVYSPGDDPATLDKKEGNYHASLGFDKSFNPCLILFNDDYLKWMGAIAGNATSLTTNFDNVWFYQAYGSFQVTPKLNIGASFAYAYADEKPAAAYVSDKYGYEMDVTLKYKIYDNLEYMIGGAYLWTGDYFKGTNANVKLSDNYLITHKLTLTF